MAYIKNTYSFPYAIEIEEYPVGRYGAPGMVRLPKRKPTQEQIERQNQYNKEKRCRRKLRKYFKVNDYFVTLTYRRDERPEDMVTAKKDFKKFISRLRKQYDKDGIEMRWIRNIETGTKGSWHIHLVINRISDGDIAIKDSWPHGKVEFQTLNPKREFAQLAAYITKGPKTDKRIREASYSTSRNMPLPDPKRERRIIWKKKEKLYIPKGYYLDEESYCEGLNPRTGRPFRHYSLLKIRRIDDEKT